MNGALALGLTLFLTLVAAFVGAHEEEEPPGTSDTPLAPIPAAHVLRSEPLDETARAEGESALGALRYLWSLPATPSCVRSATVILDDWDQPAFRLWVRGYPGLAEAWARRALADDGFDPRHRSWAVLVFGQLTAVGYPGAEAFLARLCDDSLFRSLAILALVESGAHVRHASLLRRLEREGVPGALDALSYFSEDPPPGAPPRFVLRSHALRDGTWSELARRVILGSEGPRFDEQYLWALRIARERRPPWLEAVLRERLAKRRPVHGWIHLDDGGYDLALLTLAVIGGALDARERAYLHQYGYGCEPRARLAEVLQEKGY